MELLSVLFLVLALSVSKCHSEDGDEIKNVAVDDEAKQSEKGIGDWFKNAAEAMKSDSDGGIDVLKDWTEGFKKSESGIDAMKEWRDGLKEKSESGIDAMKEWSEGFKEKSESGFGSMKDWASGFGDRFGKAKEKVEEAGEKMKESIGDAALNVKDEVESAASKVSKHAKEASDTMMKMFRF